MIAEKMPESSRREITVSEIMLKIKEIAEKKRRGIAPAETSGNDRRNFNFVNPPRSETIFYTFAKKTGRRLKQFGLFGFVEKVKNLFPNRLKYKIHFKSVKFPKKP